MRKKLTLAIGSIAVVLLASIAISFMEYRNMSSYVSDMIADDISSVNVARNLASTVSRYNLDILAVIVDESSVTLPEFDESSFKARCDSLKMTISNKGAGEYADSVMYSYVAYMMTSLELEDVMKSDSSDVRGWYFERLQPFYDRLNNDIGVLVEAIYSTLVYDSYNFDNGFYRSIIPGIVAVGVGIMLLLMLLFFLIVYYANPIIRMKNSARSFLSFGKKYNCTFEGDDQLKELNDSISELCTENQILLRRVKNHESKGNQ
mgnify:CR=1 FL=1